MQLGDAGTVEVATGLRAYPENAGPNDVFYILLLTGEPSQKNVVTITRRNDAGRWRFGVDVCIGNVKQYLYNNDGKRRIVQQFNVSNHALALATLDLLFHDFLMGNGIPEITEIKWNDELGKLEPQELHGLPMRWASGGMQPIARIGDKRYAVFFYRDIDPVGLNQSNGGSENISECRDLRFTLRREAFEELMILNEGENKLVPLSESGVEFLAGCGQQDPHHTNQEYCRIFCERAKQQLEWKLKIDTNARQISALRGPTTLNVFCGGVDDTRPYVCPDVYATVNSAEFGMEVIRPYLFSLNENEIIVDGEITPTSRDPNSKLLLRPAVLIEWEALRAAACQNKNNLSLGEIISSNNSRCIGGKRVPRLHKDSYKIFYPGSLDQASEKKKRLDDALTGEKDAGLNFCPSTWKTIEMMLKFECPTCHSCP